MGRNPRAGFLAVLFVPLIRSDNFVPCKTDEDGRETVGRNGDIFKTAKPAGQSRSRCVRHINIKSHN